MKSLRDINTHYCPGCGHGIVHKLVCEVIDELGIREKMIAVAPVGCAVFGYNYWNFDTTEAPHGRTPAVATAIKRVHPENIIMSYQGDGDLAAIGTAEIIHAANRGENITVIFVNNAIYGMTGGQMAPTSLVGQKTTTSQNGRTVEMGYPIKICEVLNQLEAPRYLIRTSVHDPANVIKTKKAIKRAFELQLACEGFTLVEVLAMCPTNWKETPVESIDYVKKMSEFFKLGVVRE